LFDAVASIAGVRQAVNYEGQAAIEFEALADRAEMGEYRFSIEPDDVARAAWRLNAVPVIRSVVDDVRSGVSTSVISARFHNGLAAMVRDVCELLRARRGLNEVALSGGVFQNVTLLKRTLDRLRAAGFVVYTQHVVPPNDGGLSLGQAVIAAALRVQGR
ncbi:MAG TPA: carbamoyltransferase HypF, partial [Anaerolineae bacterium]